MSQHIRTIHSISELYQTADNCAPFSDHFDCRHYEDLDCSLTQTIPAYRSMFNQVCLLLKGRLEVQVNDKLYQVGPGSLFVAGTGNVQSWVVTEELQGYVLTFSDGFLSVNVQRSDLFENFAFLRSGGAQVVTLDRAELGSFCTLYRQILKEQQQPTADKFEFIQSYLLILLMKARRALNPQAIKDLAEQGTARLIVNHFQRLISRHLQAITSGHATGQKHLRDFAGDLNLHPNYLNETVKKVIGKSAGQVLRERITQEALIQLRQTDLTITEVAYKLGFETAAYFSCFFKRETGYTPTQYRKAIRL